MVWGNDGATRGVGAQRRPSARRVQRVLGLPVGVESQASPSDGLDAGSTTENGSASAVWVRRDDSMRRQPPLDVDDVEAHERADLVEGNPALVHQSADEPFGDAEPSCKPDDIEHPLAIRRLTITVRCHAPHREATPEIRGS
jgi:hypothetical protein